MVKIMAVIFNLKGLDWGYWSKKDLQFHTSSSKMISVVRTTKIHTVNENAQVHLFVSADQEFTGGLT